ncbi:hypothetical protein EJB05_25244 [Eragrostis curvula]|uniref:Uncharacterized protein n=1 Tax=Eragrostis curvula TaxID=38414 RepID=A0A5J9VDE0_9POAL|nr:hypothetical protein EJB05_25244 [Eragrostis curvula]
MLGSHQVNSAVGLLSDHRHGSGASSPTATTNTSAPRTAARVRAYPTSAGKSTLCWSSGKPNAAGRRLIEAASQAHRLLDEMPQADLVIERRPWSVMVADYMLAGARLRSRPRSWSAPVAVCCRMRSVISIDDQTSSHSEPKFVGTYSLHILLSSSSGLELKASIDPLQDWNRPPSCEQLKQDNSETIYVTSQSSHPPLPILRGNVAESANQLGVQMEFLQSLELAYGVWDLATEFVCSKIKDSERATEVVMASPENSELGAITKPWWDTPTKFVVTELKHS